MNILFTHCWQTGNTGDVAIWKSMAEHLKPDELTICSQQTEQWDVDQLNQVVKTKVVPLLTTDVLVNMAVVINQGGGYMNGNVMREHFLYMRMAQQLGKPTFFGSQTFLGKLNQEVKELGRVVLNNANLVVAREEQSYKHITEYIGAKGKHIKLLPDGVFTVKAKKYPNIPKNAVKIAIRGYLADHRLLEEIAKLADMVVDTMAPVVFIPVGHGSRDDRVQAKEIVKMMKQKAIVIQDRPDAGQLIGILKDGILISNRYHGIVYSASACTPFVPMTPDIDYKMPGLLKMIDYPYSEIFNTKNIVVGELYKHTLDVWKNRDRTRKKLEKTIPEVKRKAESVYDEIIKTIR